MVLVEKIHNPESEIEPIAQLFKALSDPARLRILNLLAHSGELCNCHIEAVTQYGSSKISRHFNYLKQSKLIQSRRDGLWIYYSLQPTSDSIQKTIHQILDLMPDLYQVFRSDLEALNKVINNNVVDSCNK
jgi:ArsR family transcriptional regulator